MKLLRFSIPGSAISLLLLAGLSVEPVFAFQAAGNMPRILPLKERADLTDRWLQVRLERIVPRLMRREEIDMWVLIGREYNEDPVLKTMLPATWLNARRRTILLFFDPGHRKDVERLAVSRYDVGTLFRSEWNKEEEPDQWRRLAELIEQRNPRKIALNSSTDFALADGLTHSEHDRLLEALSPTLQSRMVSGEKLAVGWLETRIEEEIKVYPAICRIAHRIIAEGLSDSVIQPGVTTTGDVEWWFRERVAGLKLDTWFHPSVSLQRADAPERGGSFASRRQTEVIRHGDLLHVDFGITYLALNTDTQQHAYVLRPEENDAPEGLKKALKTGNRLQDILTSRMAAGRSGNEVLAQALAQASREGIKASIYTHPIGFHGHGAGPAIGMWDQQEGVAGAGDYPMFPNTAYSIELNAAVELSEWGGKEVRIMLEEDAYFDGESVRYLDGRQTRLHLIPAAP